MVDFEGNIPRWAVVGAIAYISAASGGLVSWPQYYAAKGAIAAAANAFLSYKGYALSRLMFNHGLWGYGKSPSSALKKLMISRLKSSDIMNEAIPKIMSTVSGKKVNQKGSVEFTATNKVNADLYYSLQHVSFSVKGTKTRGIWKLRVTVSDRYDFDNIRSFSGLTFGNAANDLGWAMQQIGMMTPYSVSISYTIRW